MDTVDTIVFNGTLNNKLEVCVWWLVDEAQYLVEVVNPNNVYDESMDIYIKEPKGVLSYLSELQLYK